MPSQSLPHVFRRNGHYYLRIVVPKALRELVGKRELRYALHTGYRSEACSRGSYVVMHVKKLFTALQTKGGGLPELTKDNITEVVEKFIRSRLDDFLDVRAKDAQHRAMLEESVSADRISDKNSPLQQFIQLTNFDFPHNRLSALLEVFLVKNEYETKRHSLEFHHLLNALNPVDAHLKKYFNAVINGDEAEAVASWDRLEKVAEWNHAMPKTLPATTSQSSPAPAPSPTQEEGPKLSYIIDEYKKERVPFWSKSTASEYASILSTFVEIVGDISGPALAKAHLLNYKKILNKLPHGGGQKAQFKGVPIAQVLNMAFKDKLTTKTVNKHLAVISGLLDWASGQGHCTANHALGLRIKVKATDPREARDPWSDEELRVLFSPEHYPLHGESHMFWLPILGILTGARLDELSQLRPQDVRNEEGLWYIDINDTGDKTVKTIWSVRKVPLHPLLANTLKFQEFANRREGEGETHLFPELFGFASDSRKIASSHFSKFKLRVLKIDNPKISFHSLRHTVKQSLSKLKVAPVTRNDLQGWQNEGVPDGTYGMRTPLQTLYDDAVARLPLAFDSSFLACSKWVTGELVKTTGKPRKKRMKWKG